MLAYYQLSSDEALRQLETTPSGLSSKAIPVLQAKFGLNILRPARQKTRRSILLSQFRDVMIIILIIAAGISFAVGEYTDAFVILAIIAGNAWIGYLQEYRAERSVQMLQKMAAQYAVVLRDTDPSKIEAGQLVPGDIILLEAGNIVPADARLIAVNSLKTNEASLTGESVSIEKNTESLAEPDLVPGDQRNMVFKGTIVSSGSAKAVVTATGMHTEIGKVAGLMETGTPKTPLQKRLAVFSRQLAVIVIIICIAVFALGWWLGSPPFQMFLATLSLAVAALPEALPAVITIALAQGARRMVKQKALIRKLPAVETLGSVTYICSDKTGTLTQNVMTVEKSVAVNGKEDWLNYAMLLNNEVQFSQDEGLLGDSTETALVKYALGNGYSKEEADAAFPLLEKLHFDPVRMRMSTLHRHHNQWVLFVKGAPGKITEVLSAQYKEQIPQWLGTNREWAAEGLRVLFFAYKVFDQDPADMGTGIESDLDFLGMTAMIDPPREEVIEAIEQCKTAGIKSVMITGDQPLTAHAIAKRLQMIGKTDSGIKTGADLKQLTPEELSSEIKKISVYARVSPEQKLNIVKALQINGEFVAMTGDGVNDAPSLKQADIGVAMGITGTDVSKEAADMILLDDNFATIVKAVREGRRIYENIRKFIVYVLSCNLGEILTICCALILGFAIPLLPVHILWINLVTDGLPGLALVAEPAEKDIMNRPPRPPKENLFAGGLVPRILFTGMILAGAAIFVQWWLITNGYNVRTQQTAVFTTLCLVQLTNVLSVRSAYHSVITTGILSNRGIWVAVMLAVMLQLLIVYLPALHPVFKTNVLPWDVVSIILLVSVACLVCIELVKYFNGLKYLKKEPKDLPR